jgi:hypothetical protein
MGKRLPRTGASAPYPEQRRQLQTEAPGRARRETASASASAAWRSPTWSNPASAAGRRGRGGRGRPGGVLGGQLHHPAKARRIIYLFMAGGPSQIETFDYKPVLNERNGEQLPDSVRQGQRLTGMSGNQSSLPLAGSQFGFGRHGQPRRVGVRPAAAHRRRSWTTSASSGRCTPRRSTTIPAITFLQTGSQIAGRPSMGAWVHYGLGSDHEDLPAFVVLITPGKVDQPLYARLWGSGFLPSEHQGVQFRSGTDAVLYLNNPRA